MTNQIASQMPIPTLKPLPNHNPSSNHPFVRKYTHTRSQFTGSQESILQLDLDTEEGESLPHNHSDDNQRARSVSPTFVIQLDNEVWCVRTCDSLDDDDVLAIQIKLV